jgi:hypothetical protein
MCCEVWSSSFSLSPLKAFISGCISKPASVWSQAILYSGNPVLRQSCTQAILYSGNPVLRQSCTQAILYSGNPVLRRGCL